jgi:PAS domain S-box-containing protein
MKKSNTSKRQNKTEIALLESERKFRETVKYLDEGYYSVTTEGLLLDHNLAFNRILGIDIDQDMKGAKLPDFWQNPDDRKVYLQELMTRGSIMNYLINAKKFNGERVVVMANAHLVKDEKGGLVRIEGTYNDFTRMKLTEEALKESEAKYKALFENAQVGMYRSKIDGSAFLDVNNKFAEIIGFAREELPGSAGRIRWANQEDRDKMMSLLKEQGGILNNYEARVLAKNGEIRDVLASIELHPDEGYLNGTMIDITERKRAEDNLRESERKLREAQDMAHLGFWNWDVKTGDVEWSEEVFKIFCLDPKEFTPHIDSILALSPWPEDHQRDKELINRAVETHSPGSYEQKFLRPDKSIGHYYSTFQGNYDENGNLVSIVGTVLDITESKIAETQIRELNEELELRVIQRTEQLEAANKELEAFSYSVSHDLRAPLRAIDGFSKFVLEDYETKLDPEGKRLLCLIRSNTQKMDHLITDLLALSRVTRSELNFSGIDMTQMAISMFNESATPDIHEKMSLTVDQLPEAFADPTYIRQVWANLISNAIKFSSKEKKPLIKICGHTEDEFNVYYVKDNGVGYNPAYAHKLFGVFQRLHRSDDFEGTGVGLAIVQRIIHRHGGKVWAEGEEGGGATFYFSLPVKKQDKRQKIKVSSK